MNTETPDDTSQKDKKRSAKRTQTTAQTGQTEWPALVQQERLAHHLGDLVAQAEAQAAAEREEERAERREQQAQLLQAVRDLTNAVQAMTEGNGQAREQMETLQSEVRTLRAAILLAHSIGRDEGGQTPLGLDVAKGDPFDPFQIPVQTPEPASSSSRGASRKNGPKRTHTMTPEARAKISEAQKARWEAFRRDNNR